MTNRNPAEEQFNISKKILSSEERDLMCTKAVTYGNISVQRTLFEFKEI